MNGLSKQRYGIKATKERSPVGEPHKNKWLKVELLETGPYSGKGNIQMTKFF